MTAIPFRRRARLRWLACSTLPALACPGIALAEFDFKSHVGSEYEYNSNVFETSGSDEAFAQNGDTEQADNLLSYLAGLDVHYTAGQQKFRAGGDVREVTYDRFDQLDHTEHRVEGALDWRLGSATDGTIYAREQKHLASLADIGTSELTEQTERAAGASVNVNVTPTWRVEAAARGRRSELPLPLFPDFELRESGGTLGVKFIGLERVAIGVAAGYVSGEYTGVPDAREFDETSLEVTADYILSGVSTLNARAGAVRREEDRDDGGPSEDVDGFTGSLGYKRVLSEKTTVDAQVFQRIDSYIAGANALIDTGVNAGVLWRATEKIAVNGRAYWVRSEFESGGGEGRRDNLSVATLDVTYQVLTWLLLRPFAEYRDRSSNIDSEEFDAEIAGLEVRLVFD